MSTVTEAQIIEALSTVQDPDLKKDLVTLAMVEDIVVDTENNVSFSVVLTTPACPLKEQIKQSCIDAIRTRVPDAAAIEVNMTAKTTSSCGHHHCNHERPLKEVKNIIAVASG